MYDYLFNKDPTLSDVLDKPRNIRNMMLYMMGKTNRMFEYTGLPDSIPQRDLELATQYNGYSIWLKHEGEVYALRGGLGGEPNAYYMPTEAVVANPALRNLKTKYVIDKDCVVMPNDCMYLGLYPIVHKWCSLLAENDISLRTNSILSRTPYMIVTEDTNTFESAKKFIDDVIEGKLGVMSKTPFLEGVSVLEGGNGQTRITDLIEYEQYLRAGLYNDLGLNALFNMKREYVGSEEVALQSESLYPLPDDMLHQRKQALEKINKMFGLNISVDFDSSWELQNREEVAGDDSNTLEGRDTGNNYRSVLKYATGLSESRN